MPSKINIHSLSLRLSHTTMIRFFSSSSFSMKASAKQAQHTHSTRMAPMDTVWSWLHYTYLTPSERTQLADHAHHGTVSADRTTMRSSGWTAWSLTEILYREHDLASRVFALSSFLPLVVVLFLSGLASAPSPQTRQPALMLLMFLVLCVAINVTLKSVIRSPRPLHPSTLQADRVRISYSTEHGMPSDHAQFTSFFVCYLIFKGWQGGCQVRAPRRGEKAPLAAPHTPPSAVLSPSKKQVCLFVFVDAVVCAGRVYNSYHTVGQVLAGAVLGALLAAVCVQGGVQRAMRTLTTRVMTPIMLIFTSWTSLLY